MKIYFSPLACSLASRIAVYEAGANATFVEVDPKTKRTPDGVDFRTINPLALVPTLLTDDGHYLTENAAILQYIAEQSPGASLAPTDVLGRARVRQWLSFVGTELHKALYVPLLDKNAPEGAKTFALSKAHSRLAWVAAKVRLRRQPAGCPSRAFGVPQWVKPTRSRASFLSGGSAQGV